MKRSKEKKIRKKEKKEIYILNAILYSSRGKKKRKEKKYERKMKKILIIVSICSFDRQSLSIGFIMISNGERSIDWYPTKRIENQKITDTEWKKKNCEATCRVGAKVLMRSCRSESIQLCRGSG